MRNISLMLFLILWNACLYAQNFEHPGSQPLQEKTNTCISAIDSLDMELEKIIASDNIVRSGYYLKRSSIYQYSALGCAALSGVFFLAGSKCNARLDQNGEVIDYGNRDVWRFLGYAAAAAGIMCEVCSIHFKWKSGNTLILQAKPNEITASLKF